jgi:putative phage DNA packaging protein (terminase)
VEQLMNSEANETNAVSEVKKLSDIFPPELVEYYKQNKNLITEELLDTLRTYGNDGKALALEILDTPMDDEKYHLDAFGNRIFFNGNRQLKRPFTKMPIAKIHEIEIKKCADDIYYFMDNYIRITTPKGLNFPELREYQREFISVINKQENEKIISLQPRQCISSDTIVNVNGNDLSIKELFDLNESNSTNPNTDKFIETIELSKLGNFEIKSDIGLIKIKELHKTKELPMCIIKTKNLSLKCAKNHILIDEFNNEIPACLSLNRKIKTEFGVQEIIEYIDLNINENCYDLTLENHHLYYSNGFLSHNSGKSVTVGIWILHVFLFQKDLIIGIASNKLAMSKEFVDKVKKMFLTVPMWLQCGILNWNVATIEGENRIKILSDTSNSSSFRGFSVNYLIVDEASWIIGTDSSGTSFKAFADSIFPAQEALANKKTILISTANGKNHFYDIWEGAGETKETSDNGYVKYEVKWQNVPRHKPTGELYEPEEFRNSVIKSYGAVFFNQNYGNEFIGSSNTLIDGKVLAKYQYQQPDFVRNPGLKIYEEPIKGHSYIFGVDSAKDGSDSFAIQVLDITNFNFRQVATAKLKIDYLRMPEFIDDWAKYFNNAFVIVENNEGAGQSVADRLYLEFEYENLYFDKSRTSVGSKKKYPGFRTTKKSRDIILQTLKTMAESDKLLIQDKDTIDELFNFVLKDNKYQADNNKHDDLVMALALCFAIFAEARNFNEMNEIVKELDSKSSDSDLNVSDYLIIGNFDILTDDSNNNYLNDEDFSSKFGSFDYIE